MLYFKLLLTPYKNKKAVKKEKLFYFPHKVKELFDKKLVLEQERILLNVFHVIRNQIYNKLPPKIDPLLKLANSYLVFSRDL